MKHRLFSTIFVLAFIILMMNGIYSIRKMSKPPLNSRDFSHAEIQQEFEFALVEWIMNQDYFDVYDVFLECNIDELLLKRDINQIRRGKRTTIRVPSGYEMAHKLGYTARKGYSYKYANLNMKSVHRLQHHIMGYKY